MREEILSQSSSNRWPKIIVWGAKTNSPPVSVWVRAYKGDIRSHFLDCEPASSLDCLGWRGAVMSPFCSDGDLAGTPVSFSPSVRRMRCSQVGGDVLRQDATVLR